MLKTITENWSCCFSAASPFQLALLASINEVTIIIRYNNHYLTRILCTKARISLSFVDIYCTLTGKIINDFRIKQAWREIHSL
jgi:hypothetical protein